MDKFDEMMAELKGKEKTNRRFGQILAADREFELLNRAWCAGRLISPQSTCIFSLDLKRAKILKYHQNTKIHLTFKMLKYRLYRRRILREKRHFAAFFEIYRTILRKMNKLAKTAGNLRTKFGNF